MIFLWWLLSYFIYYFIFVHQTHIQHMGAFTSTVFRDISSTSLIFESFGRYDLMLVPFKGVNSVQRFEVMQQLFGVLLVLIYIWELDGFTTRLGIWFIHISFVSSKSHKIKQTRTFLYLYICIHVYIRCVAQQISSDPSGSAAAMCLMKVGRCKESACGLWITEVSTLIPKVSPASPVNSSHSRLGKSCTRPSESQLRYVHSQIHVLLTHVTTLCVPHNIRAPVMCTAQHTCPRYVYRTTHVPRYVKATKYVPT